jgi:hypothetical protein
MSATDVIPEQPEQAEEAVEVQSGTPESLEPDTAFWGPGRRERRKERRAARSRLHTIIRRTIVVILLVFLIVAGWSYGRALTAPGRDSWTDRSVEWVRDHGGAGLVNRIESWWE